MLDRLNPFVRYARRQIVRGSDEACITLDHRLFYCQMGEFTLTAEDSFTLTPGCAVYLPAATPYRIHSAKNRTVALVYNFDLTPDFSHHRESLHTIPLSRFDGNYPFRETPLAGFESPVFSADARQSEGFLLRGAELFTDTDTPHWRELTSAYLKSALLLMLTDAPSAVSPIVKRACDYVRKNFDRELTNEKLARMMGYHPNYLHRLFKKEFGMGLREYIVSVRIREAKRMLAEQDIPISDIALSCGFGDVSYFSQCFRRHAGMTPSEFRRLGLLP
ncbi:MAG: helix-turn-helix domain-containing protein [Ruminococcaceae bacterium]|nr:helix-turn-helix domain-containing protein [Oscillospiraceae bacterium]